MTKYPSFEDVIFAHNLVITRFGGTFGVRDQSGLESAIARPQSGYFSDLIQQAAALLESLSQNHPFLDGNKRTAITVTSSFLRVNGYRLEFDDFEAYEFLIELYNQGRFRFDKLEPWLRAHTRKTSEDD